MKIFISWSGVKSKAVANSLRQWIPDVIQSIEPWMSGTDIDAGARWNRHIDQELSNTQFGILCLTKSNLNAPWILFEAGALAKTVDDTFVCPYLIDLSPAEVTAGPLTQFQAKSANEVETWELILTINKALKDDALPEDKLRRIFQRWWPDLKATLDKLPEEESTAQPERSAESMLEEVLDTVRGLSRRAASEQVLTRFGTMRWRGRLYKLMGKVKYPEHGEGVVTRITSDAITVKFDNGEEPSFILAGESIQQLEPLDESQDKEVEY